MGLLLIQNNSISGTIMIGGITIGSLTTGLVTRLIASGIQRVGSLTFQKAIRISRIEQTLRMSSSRNPNVKLAVDDFETLIGSRYGGLNEQLAHFIEELERGGLITAMVEDALLDRPSQEVRASFATLHSRAFPTDQGAADDLYTKLMVSFTITFRELSKSLSGIMLFFDRAFSA
jgi:hypothetical protein